jgi:hypothetical protein
MVSGVFVALFVGIVAGIVLLVVSIACMREAYMKMRRPIACGACNQKMSFVGVMSKDPLIHEHLFQVCKGCKRYVRWDVPNNA